MLNRWIGITAVALMLSANVSLFMRDIVPDWIAGDPPDNISLRLGDNETRKLQVGIYDTHGGMVGQSWSVALLSTNQLRVSSWTVLYPLRLPGGAATPRVRIDTEMAFASTGAIDTLEIRVHGFDLPVYFKGEYVPPDKFPCEWRVGEQSGKLVLDSDRMRSLGDMFRPFDHLPGMYVGRTWRLKLFNPLAKLLPPWRTSDMAMESVLVRVVALDTIKHEGREVEAYRVEAPQIRAWVGHDGTVYRQELDLPLFGRLIVQSQEFDDELRKRRIHEFIPSE